MRGGKPKLPDLLRPGLALVFVGTAASRRSAEVGAYYAHPGNRFWRTLHEVGITTHQYEPHQFRDLLALGIGFTDMSKQGSGMDHEIARHQFDMAGFETKMRRYQPRAVAFTSKRAAGVWLGTSSTSGITLGRQSQRPSQLSEVFVLTSPSGAATRYWDVRPWRELADWLAAARS